MEELKRQAEWARQVKKSKKVARDNDPSTLQDTDVLFVLHHEEVKVVEDCLLECLMTGTFSTSQKQHILNVLKYLQED
jgi:hypothetical protein